MSNIYKELGICVVCGKRETEPNRVSCFECLERDRRYMAMKRKKGLCDNNKINQAHRNLYAKRKEEGICTKCGKRKATNGILCLDCYVKSRRNRNEKKDGILRMERPNYGMCYFCGNPVFSDKHVCQCCYDRLLVNTSKMNESVRMRATNGMKIPRPQLYCNLQKISN